jgi:hypothetical protein
MEELEHMEELEYADHSTSKIVDDINYYEMLDKYGPEGCYEIAQALMKVANEDISDALESDFVEDASYIKVNTTDEAVEFIYPYFEGMNKYFDEMDEDSFAAYCHSQLSGGIGMNIRNTFGLWQESILYEYMRTTEKIEHPDGMSDLIIRKVYEKYKNNDKI